MFMQGLGQHGAAAAADNKGGAIINSLALKAFKVRVLVSGISA
jgi:hypothetical protein